MSRWLPDRTFDVVTMTAHVARIKDDLVSFTQHYELDDGEKLISSADMRFRSEQASARQLRLQVSLLSRSTGVEV